MRSGPSSVEGGDPNALLAGDLRLTATFNSVGVELPFTGDANGNAAAALAFRPAGTDDTAWRQGLPLWRTDDGSAAKGGPGAAFYGSALLLDAGTSYEIQVTLEDPEGMAGAAVLSGIVTTRAEDIPPAEALAPTYYVRAEGSDSNPGTSPESAWRTLQQAMKGAPAGAVVQVGPGYFTAPDNKTVRTQPLTLVAQYPAVDDARTVINDGQHSVVEPAAVAAPAGSGEANAGVWQRVTLSGPGRGGAPAGAPYPVWKWANSPVSGATQLGYAPSHAAAPSRVANWKKDNADLATPAGWAEKLYTNQSYHYGFYAAGTDLYLRLPGDLDPNTQYVSASGGIGLAFNGPAMRVSGLEVRQFSQGLQFGAQATFGVVDHALLSGTRYGVAFQGSAGPPAVYGSDHVVQYTRIQDSSLWTADPVATPGIPWNFIKGTLTNADGSKYGTNRVGEQSEGTAIKGRGGAQRVVVRYTTIDGPFNGIAPGDQTGYDRYAGMDMDIHDNLLRHIADDAFEPEGPAINVRIWGNRLEQTTTALSTGPVRYGPLYFVRNTAWQLGNDGVPLDDLGNVGAGPVGFKYSGSSNPPARIWVLHNTFYADGGLRGGTRGVSGGDQYAGGGNSPERYYLRNNIFRMTKYAFAAPGARAWDEDYDYFFTTQIDGATRGIDYASRNYPSIAGYRVASGQGAHSNRSGDIRVADPGFVDAAGGDLALPSGSPLIDAGVPVPNVSDRPGLDFAGAAPDLGAREIR